MTPTLLREAGLLLYGDRWQTALADALAVNPRTVRAWYSGRHPIQAGPWRGVVQLLLSRESQISVWLDEHEKRTGGFEIINPKILLSPRNNG